MTFMLDRRPQHQNDMKLQPVQQTSPTLCWTVWYIKEIMHKDVMQRHEHRGVLHYVMGI